MRFVTRKEDQRNDEEIFFLKALVDSLREEIRQMRAQIDEAREIPPYIFDTGSNKAPAKVYAMNDKNTLKAQRGEDIDTSS
jgi:hypothetical protein